MEELRKNKAICCSPRIFLISLFFDVVSNLQETLTSTVAKAVIGFFDHRFIGIFLFFIKNRGIPPIRKAAISHSGLPLSCFACAPATGLPHIRSRKADERHKQPQRVSHHGTAAFRCCFL